MAIKVQGSSVPAVQSEQAQSTQQTPFSQQAQSAQRNSVVPYGKDVFITQAPQPPPDLRRLIGPEKPTLNFGDRFNAMGLKEALSSPLNALRLAVGEKSETITRDLNGTYRGPEGQPLVQVKLADGNTAYVDPNTNKYYLTDEKPDAFGQVRTLPAANLPEGAQFSNSHFSDADVKELTRIANGGSPFPPDWGRPPRDIPFHRPDRPGLDNLWDAIPVPNRDPIV